MTFYQSIDAVQRPFQFNVDDNDRPMFSVNFTGNATAPVSDWPREVQKVLSNAGLSTLGVDTWIGSKAVIPGKADGAGPWIQILDQGGAAASFTHNDDEIENLSVQIVIRADDYNVADARALAIWRALNNTRNTTIAA